MFFPEPLANGIHEFKTLQLGFAILNPRKPTPSLGGEDSRPKFGGGGGESSKSLILQFLGACSLNLGPPKSGGMCFQGCRFSHDISSPNLDRSCLPSVCFENQAKCGFSKPFLGGGCGFHDIRGFRDLYVNPALNPLFQTMFVTV